MTPDFQYVPEAIRGQERRLWQFLLEHGVRHDGSAMDQHCDVLGVHDGKFQAALDGIDQGTPRIASAAGNFCNRDATAVLLQDRNVRKGTADIDAEPYRSHT